MSTTVMISEDTWQQLDGLKERGESFDDVIQELLEGHAASEEVVGDE